MSKCSRPHPSTPTRQYIGVGLTLACVNVNAHPVYKNPADAFLSNRFDRKIHRQLEQQSTRRSYLSSIYVSPILRASSNTLYVEASTNQDTPRCAAPVENDGTTVEGRHKSVILLTVIPTNELRR